LTPEERQQLLALLDEPGQNGLTEQMHEEFVQDLDLEKKIDPAISNRLLDNIHTTLHFTNTQERTTSMFSWAMKLTAACVIGMLAIGSYLFLKPGPQKLVAQKKNQYQETG